MRTLAENTGHVDIHLEVLQAQAFASMPGVILKYAVIMAPIAPILLVVGGAKSAQAQAL